jgi:hypothetical protein
LIDGSAASAFSMSAGSAFVPHSYSSAVTSAHAHHEHVVAGVHDVDDRRLHGAGAAGGEDEHIVLGLIDVLEARDHLGEDLGEARRAVVHDRLAEGRQHLRRHGRRSGGQKEAFQHGVVLSSLSWNPGRRPG